MILLIEPVSKNIGMYVPAYPLPIMEIASFVKSSNPLVDLEVISIPMDFGLPLTLESKNNIYQEVIKYISSVKPEGIGLSCTAISQAEETIQLCELIKLYCPETFIFVGGYFPTIYYEEILERTSSIDLIVAGEGEEPTLKIIEKLQMSKDPRLDTIPNLIWKKNGRIHFTEQKSRFDLKRKAPLKLELLKNPRSYDILPYSFSRGCPYQCNFCMEDYIRPTRRAVPENIIEEDLRNLSCKCNSKDIVVCDALFKSFDMVPLLRELKMKIHFETRCDVMDSSIISSIADVCGTLVMGFESASFNTLIRMNKVKNREHYNRYITNARAIFNEAVRNEIPVMVFMIAGYPGDTEDDLNESLKFTRELSSIRGPGGHIFKIGECHVYPKTKIHNLARSLPDVIYDNDGVFGSNIVRQSSRDTNFETILSYIGQIYALSNITPKLQASFLKMIPFFRLPASLLTSDLIPDICYKNSDRNLLEVNSDKLAILREFLPQLRMQAKERLSIERKDRVLKI